MLLWLDRHGAICPSRERFRLCQLSLGSLPEFIINTDIRSPNDLRGKRVNILNYGGSNDLALQLALKSGA
jgi:hypothetical protein